MKKRMHTGIIMLLLLCFILSGCTQSKETKAGTSDPANNAISDETNDESNEDIDENVNKQSALRMYSNVEAVGNLQDAPAFSDSPYVVLNDNEPFFTDAEMVTDSFELYSELDVLGRCQVAYANIGKDLMPTEKRGKIGQVKPSGWQTVKYDNVDGKYLYNRCHLIGFQLSGENANEGNLITGTRYMNVEGMLPFENMVADYVKETGNHVLYRVTPIFQGDNLVPSGVQMEAKSVEDNGEGILYCVYVYNNQPGIDINYATGESVLQDESVSQNDSVPQNENVPQNASILQNESVPQNDTSESSNEVSSYILNTNTRKFHQLSCSSVATIKAENKQEYAGNREDLIVQGYDSCKNCNP